MVDSPFLWKNRAWRCIALGLWCALFVGGCQCDEGIRKRGGALATDLPAEGLVFEDQKLDQKLRKSFVLYNDGAGPLELRGIAIGGPQADSFRLIGLPKLPLTLEVGVARGVRIEVEFRSQATRGLLARIEVRAEGAGNTDDEGLFTIPLRNELQLGRLQLSCDEGLDFGAVAVGRSRLLECSLQNRGAAPITLRSATYVRELGERAFALVGASFPKRLRPQESWKLFVRFAPLETQHPLSQGAFEFQSDLLLQRDQQKPRILLKGRVDARLLRLVPDVGPCFEHDYCRLFDPSSSCVELPLQGKRCRSDKPPTALRFFSQLPSPQAAIVVESVGTLPVTLSKWELLQEKDLFFIGSKSPPGNVLTPGSSFRVPVGFVGKERLEVSAQALFVVHSDAQNGVRQSLKVSNEPSCRLWISGAAWPQDVDFGEVAVGEIQHRELQVQSLGGRACTLRKVELQGSSAFQIGAMGSLPMQLKDRETAKITLQFKPTAVNESYKGRLVLRSDDPGRPALELPLTGKSGPARRCLRITPALELDFGQATRDCPLTRSFWVQHGGGSCGDVEVSGVRLAGTLHFSIEGQPTFPLTLKGTRQFQLIIKAKNQRVGYYTTLLWIDVIRPKRHRYELFVKVRTQNEVYRHDRFRQNAKDPLVSSFPLSLPAVPNSLRTLIDGDPGAVYHYDAEKNAIVFDAHNVPQPNALIDCSYTVRCASKAGKP